MILTRREAEDESCGKAGMWNERVEEKESKGRKEQIWKELRRNTRHRFSSRIEVVKMGEELD